MIQNSAVKT